MLDDKPTNEMPFGVAVIVVLVGSGFFLAGVLGGTGPALWVHFAYRPATAMVLETRAFERPARSGRLHGLEARLGITVAGQEYERWVRFPKETRQTDGPEADAVQSQAVVGQQVACFHDPLRPAAGIVLERTKLARGMIVGVLVPLVFLAVGAGGMTASWAETFPR